MRILSEKSFILDVQQCTGQCAALSSKMNPQMSLKIQRLTYTLYCWYTAS